MRYNNTLLLDKKHFERCNHIIKLFEKRFDCKCELLGAIDSFEYSRPDCPLFKVTFEDDFYIFNESIHKDDSELKHSLDRFGKYLDIFNEDGFKVLREREGMDDPRYREFIDIRKRLRNKYPIDITFERSVNYQNDMRIYKSFVYKVIYKDETYILERKCNTSCAECVYAWLDIKLESICQESRVVDSKYNFEADIYKDQMTMFNVLI